MATGKALLEHIRELEADLDAAREALKRQLAGDESREAIEVLLMMEAERYRRAREARDAVEAHVVEITDRAANRRPKIVSKTRIVELMGIPEFTLYEWLRKKRGIKRRAGA